MPKTRSSKKDWTKEAGTSKQKELMSTRKSNAKSKQTKSAAMRAHHENEPCETKKRGQTRSKMPERKERNDHQRVKKQKKHVIDSDQEIEP